jgi:hypothetical protein
MRYTNAFFCGLLGLSLTACSTVDRRIDPDSPDAVGGAALDSQDIRAMADIMARDIVEKGVLTSNDPNQPVSFYILGMQNYSSDPIDKAIILTPIRTKLFNALPQDEVLVLDRSSATLEEVKAERRAKRSNAVTANQNLTGGLAGADYVLTGEIRDRVKQGEDIKSVYYQITFRITDLETTALKWTHDYEVKFESGRSVIVR